MQPNKKYAYDWLRRRGITDSTIELFGLKWYSHPVIGGCIKIPVTETHSKYRRSPLSDKKPKYIQDKGARITLFGADKLTGNEQEVVVTEGELDTLVLWSLNIPAVSSTGGALSFQEEWAETLPKGPQYYVCFDNDEPGAEGMVKAARILGPETKVIIIPKVADDKDISDFVARGGDFRALMDGAKSYRDASDVEEDMAVRRGMMLSTLFHQKYLDAAREKVQRVETKARAPLPTDECLRARAYPMTRLIDFSYGKALCPFHNEKTPSLHYYPEDNHAYCFGACGRGYDAIDLYRNAHPHLSFRDAVNEINKLL